MPDDDIHEDQSRWEMLRLDLVEQMMASALSDRAMISATLRALLDVLIAGDIEMNLEDAKQRIGQSLKLFRDT